MLRELAIYVTSEASLVQCSNHVSKLFQKDPAKESSEFVLLIVTGSLINSAALEAINGDYGDQLRIIVVADKNYDGTTFDYDDLNEEIGLTVMKWLSEEHPGAIPKFKDAIIPGFALWWTGVECTNDELGLAEGFRRTLPDSHREKAKTWLRILQEDFGYDDSDIASECEFKLIVATVCEWLHGFEAATGNSYNHFAPSEFAEELQLSDFYLGFVTGQYDPENHFEGFLFDSGSEEFEDARDSAIRLITQHKRSEILDSLYEFFDTDSDLFCTLYFSIWANYSVSYGEFRDELMGTSTYDELAELSVPWEFVSDGWHDKADNF